MTKYFINGHEAVYGTVEGISCDKLYISLGKGRHGELNYRRITCEEDRSVLKRFSIGDTVPCVILDEDFGYCKLSHTELLGKPDLDSIERGDEIIAKAVYTNEKGTFAAISPCARYLIHDVWVSPGTAILARVESVDKLHEKLDLTASAVLYDREPPIFSLKYGKETVCAA